MTLKMKHGLATFFAFLFLCATPAFAQSSASASASGTTQIIRPIAIAKDADLAFGTIIRPTSGTGSIAIANSADSVTAGSGAASGGGTVSRAKFSITGEGGQTVSISVPASFDLSGPSASTLTVTLDGDLGASTTLSNSLGSEGSASLNVGGSFSLPSTQTLGAYSGSFQVDVAYN